MKRHHYPFVAAAVAAALAAPLSSAWAGEIVGRVTEAATGRALPNATVRVPQLGRTVQADRSGDYRIADLPAGSYTVEVEYVGFGTVKQDVTVADTGEARQAFALGAAVGDLEEVTVTGYRLAQITALQDKKSSKTLKESVTADDAGKLPDQNAGETLARVVGVAVSTDQGEGRYVTIRGIDAALSNVTIDGQLIGSPEGDTRRVALDTVPANILSKLEVIKSATPDLDGNAIGGTVNLVTPSVFDDPDGRFFSATADYGYYDLGGQNPWGGSVGWGNVFNDRFGIVLSASYSDREFNSHNLQGGDPWVESDDEGSALIPDEMGLRDYLIRRVRKGFVANLEFRPNDNVKLHWRNLYNRYEDTEEQPEVVYDYRNGDLENQTATSGTFTEGEGERLNTKRFEIQSILSSSLGGDVQIGDWNIAFSGTYGKTEQDTPYDNEYNFELGDEIPMSYDTSDYFWVVDAGPEFQDPDNFEFNQAARGHQLIEEELRIAQLDFKRDFDWSDKSGFLKFGAKYISRENTSDQDMIVYDGFDGEDDYLLSQVMRQGDPDFYRSERNYYTFGPYPDYDLADRFFRDNEDQFEIDDADTIANSYGVDYRVKEDVTAGYIMGQLEIGSATFIGGVRVEQTDTDFDAYDIVFLDGDAPNPPPQVTGSKKYTNVLPDLLMTWAVRDDVLVRAAWTNTIGRPSYEQNVPFRIFEIEEDFVDDDTGIVFYEGAIEAGNSDLDPLESTNYDVAVEWYLQPAGLLSAGLFYKDIENPIFNRIQILEDEDFEGRRYSELEIQQPQNAQTGEILGVELGFQQQFTSLPSFLSGFGVSISYTWTDSEATVFDRDEKVPFFMQSEHVGNAALFWEQHGVELRLAYSYRSEYLDSLGDSAAQDLYVDTHGQLDFKASYEFSKQLSTFFQVQNINDEPLRFYSGDKSRLAENEIYSWNALAGMSFKF
ncbi:TonB-dependent receptor [Povalibacter uvarum]|uniref:TonB-dependent receptor n=1 Tax=Povalibacter uvarum TaxID=732238 RepID=A0A841HK59_9GAMM|nr:TonB-dependent receptor [Povalibacter uvarum]MBB6093591.1 TonB-dependent receptor [Povalibacter uvarum]